MKRGIIYTVQGEPFVREALVSLESARRVMPNIPALLFLGGDLSAAVDLSLFSEIRRVPEQNPPMRIKNMLRDSPFERSLYIDGDTLILHPLDDLFTLLDRFDFAAMHHYTNGSFLRPVEGVPDTYPEFNAGLYLFRKNKLTDKFFEDWQKCYDERHEKYGYSEDQSSFRKTVWESDMRVADVPPEFNFLPYFTTKFAAPLHVLHGRPFDWLKEVGRQCATRAEQSGAHPWPEILGPPPKGHNPNAPLDERPRGAADGLTMPDRRAWIPSIGCLRHFSRMTKAEKYGFIKLPFKLAFRNYFRQT